MLLIMLYILMVSFFSLCFHIKTYLYPTSFMSSSVWTIGLNTSHFVNEFSSI